MIRVLFFVLFCLMPASASTNEEDFAKSAKEWVEVKGQLALEAFSESDRSQRFELIDQLITDNFDVENIGKFVLGKYWREIGKQERDYYLRVFRRYSLAAYKTLPLNFSPEMKITVVSAQKTEEDKENTITVRTNVVDPTTKDSNTGQDKLFVLDFRLRKNDVDFKIFDVKLAGASLLLVYRDKFYAMIKEREEDVMWFVEDLDIMAEELEASISK